MTDPRRDQIRRIAWSKEQGHYNHPDGPFAFWQDVEAELSRVEAERDALSKDYANLLRESNQHEASLARVEAALREMSDAYPDEHDKASSDRCEHCGPVVMCSFHSLLSMVDAALASSSTGAVSADPPDQETKGGT